MSKFEISRKRPSAAKRKKITIDIVMGVTLALLVVPFHVSKVIHITIGILLLCLIGLHIFQHWAWFKALSRGKWTSRRIRKTIFVLLPAVFLIASVVLGAILLFTTGGGASISNAHHLLGIVALLACVPHVVSNIPKRRKTTQLCRL